MKMLRSYDLVMNPMREIYGEQYGHEFDWGRRFFMDFLLQRAILYGSLKSVRDPWMALYTSRGRPPLKTTCRAFFGRFRLWLKGNKRSTARKYLELQA